MYYDNTAIKFIPRFVLTFISTIGLFIFGNKFLGKYHTKYFYNTIIFCSLFQGSVLFFTFISTDFRDFLSNVFFREVEIGSEHLILLRATSFVPSGGDGLSMNQALLCLIGAQYLISNNHNQRKTFWIVLIFLCLIVTVFTGRSGFFLGLFFFICSFLINVFKYNYLKIISLLVIIIFILFLSSYLLENVIGSFAENLLKEYGFEHPLVRLLKGYISESILGSYYTSDLDIYFTTMLVFPSDIWILFFGSNNFGQLSDSFIGTDIGYLRMLHGFGIIGLIIFLIGFFFLPVYLALKFNKLNLLTKNIVFNKPILILIIVLLFGLIAHYKIFYLSSRIFVFIFFYLILLTFKKK